MPHNIYNVNNDQSNLNIVHYNRIDIMTLYLATM